jgi:hypothetical protein
MSNIITFGKHEGKTFEWLFFKAPWYAEWIYAKGIHRQRHNFSEEEEDYFDELYRRAWHLRGVCKSCNKRPFSMMGLSTHLSGALSHIGFFCDECEYAGGSPTGYHRPSFFVDTHNIPRCEQARIVGYIKNRYLGDVRLTQKIMEEFFHHDANFAHATPGFFVEKTTVELLG